MIVNNINNLIVSPVSGWSQTPRYSRFNTGLWELRFNACVSGPTKMTYFRPNGGQRFQGIKQAAQILRLQVPHLHDRTNLILRNTYELWV